ncbi:hypothetical protein NIES39_O05720 [Arthrospira platensis NIES-39]|nr:hypothetical protein NIES39_A05120 [Arthrospira platensis NIES-39]BAI93819.1 hypothetical protein NIES39_O05720 [Arthrospira platensis NIES-39]
MLTPSLPTIDGLRFWLSALLGVLGSAWDDYHQKLETCLAVCRYRFRWGINSLGLCRYQREMTKQVTS